MDTRTPIEKARYAIQQADAARKRKDRYARMSDTLRRGTTTEGFLAASTRVRGKWWIPGYAEGWDEITLDAEDTRLLSEFFYKKMQEEESRANAYEKQALEVGKDG